MEGIREKYKITKNGVDDYTLEYGEKKFDFHTDLKMMSKIQGATKTARLKMINDATKEGISLKEYTKEIKKDGKTYYDNTNKEELEKIYIDDEISNVFNEICKENFNQDLMTLIQDIGLDDNEIEKFSQELSEALLGKTPRGK